jgi:hypothetical protein
MLDSIGFDWSLGPGSSTHRHFFEMANKLSIFQSNYGHLDVPKNYDLSGLDEWVGEMKEIGSEGRMEHLHAERLLRIGFTWVEDRVTWFDMYESIRDEVEAYEAGSKSSRSLQLSEDLENWIKVQLLLLEYDLLTPRRKRIFEALGLAVEKSNIVQRRNVENEEFQLKIETTAEQGRSNGLNLKSAALCWNPHGPTTNNARTENKPTLINANRKAAPSLAVSASPAKMRKTIAAHQ